MSEYQFIAPIQDLIALVEGKMRSQADGQNASLSAALRHLLSSGGKRIRPAICLLTGKLLCGDLERLVVLSAAIELLHTATLVHDDLIDGALLRRGMATLNSSWSSGATVLTGDFIFAKAAKLAAETNSVVLMQMFAETLAVIVNGEITQMFSSYGNIAREDYYARIYAKTASLFELATMTAAMLSPVDENVVNDFKQYGYNIGMAFQIVDDILDFTGEQTLLGKPVANDLRQGLITLPTIYYLQSHGDDADIAALKNGRKLDDARFDRLIHSINESGSIDSAMDEAKEYVNKALLLLDDKPALTEREALKDLALYVVDRRL